MATVDCVVRYRPIRGGFLVREGSVEDLVKAAGLATLLWGGVYCPIIPVSGDGAFAQRLIDLFGVDVLFPISETEEIKRITSSNQFLSFSHPLAFGLLFQDWNSDKHGLFCLDVLHALYLAWKDGAKDIHEDEVSHSRLLRWDAGDPLAAMFAMVFGFYPDEYSLRCDFPKAFLEGLRGLEQTMDIGGAVHDDSVYGFTPIGATALYTRTARDRYNSGVYVGVPSSFDDLLSFWNLRAAGALLTFYPLGSESRLDGYTKAFAASLEADTTGPFLPSVFAVHCGTDNQAQAEAFCTTVETKRQRSLSRVIPEMWNGLNVKPSAVDFERHRVLANVDHKFGRPVVSLALPDRRDFLPDAAEVHPHTSRQHLVASYEPMSEFDYPDRTLRPPLIRGLQEFYSREIAFDPWALRCEKEGIARIIDAADSSMSLRPVERKKIVERIFALAGIVAKPSLPGRMASRIIEKLGGSNSIEPGRVFKIRGVRKLLRETPSVEKTSLETALATIGGDGFAAFKNLHLAGQAGNELTPSDAFNALIEKRVFAPELESSFSLSAKDLHCVACGLTSEVNAKVFEGWWECPICEERVYLPVVLRDEFSPVDVGSMWRFKRAGLFSRDNNQEGFVPVVLALMQLDAVFDDADACVTTALDLEFDGAKAELDFCALQYKYGDQIEIALGEAKGATLITEQKLEPLKTVWRKMEAIGLGCFLVFAKASDSFDESEVALFKGLTSEGIPVAAMTNRELESYEPHPGRDDLPVAHPFTLADMARNSIVKYLA